MNTSDFVLERVERDGVSHLALRDLAHPEFKPVSVDFVSGASTYRRKSVSAKDPMSKAFGPAKGRFVVDATAGFGVDAFTLASQGFRVLALERSPLVFALLEDGLKRLRDFAEREHALDLLEIANRFSLLQVSAHDWLQEQIQGKPASGAASEAADVSQCAAVVYLDPMYPEEGRSKSALPKKGMQIFRRLIGDDRDANELVALARRYAEERVVVKRPLSAPALGGRPQHSFEGKTARYDIYLVTRDARL